MRIGGGSTREPKGCGSQARATKAEVSEKSSSGHGFVFP